MTMRKVKIITVCAIAFLTGMLTHSRLDAKHTEKLRPLLGGRSAHPRRSGRASWYSKRSPGIRKTTANMEIFDDTRMTCAIWGVPFHQKIRVTNRRNGKSVVVRVNDRGPHKRYVRKGRVIDLSKGAFRKIASLRSGLIDVQLEFLD